MAAIQQYFCSLLLRFCYKMLNALFGLLADDGAQVFAGYNFSSIFHQSGYDMVNTAHPDHGRCGHATLARATAHSR